MRSNLTNAKTDIKLVLLSITSMYWFTARIVNINVNAVLMILNKAKIKEEIMGITYTNQTRNYNK